MNHASTHAHSHENTVPRAALIAAVSLVVLSVLLTAAVSLGFLEREAVPQLEREKAQVQAIALVTQVVLGTGLIKPVLQGFRGYQLR